MPADWPPAAARPAGAIKGRLGSIDFVELYDPAVLIAVGAGFISHSMIKRDIARAAEFAERHADGWTYLADVASFAATVVFGLWWWIVGLPEKPGQDHT